MPYSSRLKIVYPSDKKDSWYRDFVSMVEGFDVSVYASREDRNIFQLTGGGTVSFTVGLGGAGTLTWTSPIEIYSPNAGYQESVPAGSLEIYDKQLFYVDVTRAPITNITLDDPTVSSYINSDYLDDAMVLGFRRGNTVYFRGGTKITTGESGALFDVTTLTAVASGDTVDTFTCLASVAVNDLVYVDASNHVEKANATTVTTGPAFGIVIAKDGPGTTATVQFGHAAITGLTGLTAGEDYYLHVVAGQFSNTAPSAPGNIVQKIGVAKSSSVLIFMPTLEYTELA